MTNILNNKNTAIGKITKLVLQFIGSIDSGELDSLIGYLSECYEGRKECPECECRLNYDVLVDRERLKDTMEILLNLQKFKMEYTYGK